MGRARRDHVFLAVEVENGREIEQAWHRAFSDRRVNPKCALLTRSPDRPAAILALFAVDFWGSQGHANG